MNPAVSHFWSMVLSIGTWRSNQSCEKLSKHPVISPSSTHAADVLRLRVRKHCSIASAVDRRGLNPYEFGSAVSSAMGSKARA